MILTFSTWLAATQASIAIQNAAWVIPTVQSIHILAIAVLVAAIVAVDLRLVGLLRWAPALPALEARFLPWFWTALAILLASGAVLVVGEPLRELRNVIFFTKMGLVLTIAALAAIFQTRVRSDPAAWEGPSGGQAGAMLGAISLALIVAIIVCGRWIAYAGSLD